MVNAALAPYDALLDNDDRIARKTPEGEKPTGIKVRVKGRRLRFEGFDTGALQFSGEVSKDTVEHFVKRFWFWEKSA